MVPVAEYVPQFYACGCSGRFRMACGTKPLFHNRASVCPYFPTNLNFTERAARHQREGIHSRRCYFIGTTSCFSSRFSLLRKAVPNRRSSVSIAGFRFVTCNAIKIRIPKFERSRSPFLFRVIYFSFSHSLVPPASVLCRRFLSLAFRSLFHIPESSVGCGRSCPLVVARKRCQGLRSTGLLHAR